MSAEFDDGRYNRIHPIRMHPFPFARAALTWVFLGVGLEAVEPGSVLTHEGLKPRCAVSITIAIALAVCLFTYVHVCVHECVVHAQKEASGYAHINECKRKNIR